MNYTPKIISKFEYDKAFENHWYIIPELLLHARCYLPMKQSNAVAAGLPNPENETFEIVGTNEKYLLDSIRSILMDLGADFEMVEDYKFAGDSINVVEDDEEYYVEEDLYVKYMFLLRSLDQVDHGSCYIKHKDGKTFSNGYHDRPEIKRGYMKVRDELNKIYLPYYRQRGLNQPLYVENTNYSMQPENEYIRVIPCNEAAKVVLEVIALSMDGDDCDFLRELYEERGGERPERTATATNKVSPSASTSTNPYQESSGGSFGKWIIGAVIAVAFIAILL